MDADVTVLPQTPGRYILRDNENTEVVADHLLQPLFCLRAGTRHEADGPDHAEVELAKHLLSASTRSRHTQKARKT